MRRIGQAVVLALVATVAGMVLQCASDPRVTGDGGMVDRLLVDIGLKDAVPDAKLGDGIGPKADAAGDAGAGGDWFTMTLTDNGMKHTLIQSGSRVTVNMQHGFLNPTCGDGKCEFAQGETYLTCAADCLGCPSKDDGVCQPECGEQCGIADCPVAVCASAACGNGACESAYGKESCQSCPSDCGACKGTWTPAVTSITFQAWDESVRYYVELSLGWSSWQNGPKAAGNFSAPSINMLMYGIGCSISDSTASVNLTTVSVAKVAGTYTITCNKSGRIFEAKGQFEATPGLSSMPGMLKP